MLKKNRSINDLIKDIFYWNGSLGMIALALFISSTTLWFLKSDQNSGCTVALSIYNQYKNSISRELALENPIVAQENFLAFITDLSKVGISNKLLLKPTSEKNDARINQDFCSANFLSSQIHIPLQFGPTLSGTITGNISYFPSLSALITIWIISLLLVLALKRIEAGIKLKLNKEIIDPIKSLSIGVDLKNDTYLNEVYDINENLKLLKEKIILTEKMQGEILSIEQKNLLAKQVAHDIRSPLAALDMVVSGLIPLPDDKKVIIKSSVARIKDIANSLISQHHARNSQVVSEQTHLVFPLIEEIITEKRIQSKMNSEMNLDFKVEDNTYEVFGFFDEGQFKRILSNVIDNALEACDHIGEILISLSRIDNMMNISIVDNGKGIPAEVIPQLMSKGYSHGKENGSGLGLYHAKEMLRSWNGSISLNSIAGRTEVNISLPIAKKPKWFMSQIILRPAMKIIVVDDDPSVHHIWDQRFSIFKDHVEVFHCFNFQEASLKEKELFLHNENVLFLCDYEISGDAKTGLDFIEKLNISSRSILVTSHYSESTIQKKASRLSLKIIPKNMAGFVKIKFEDPKEIKAILIDDDDIIRNSWISWAKRKGTFLKTFQNFNDFEKEIHQVDKDTVIYIDSNLSDLTKGEIYAKKIYEYGIKNIYLTTGHDSSEFEQYPWIREVIGKSPPW